ncbi:hypothetical protein CJD36_004860 [Flavipsychrobacter stenotrophus]|uniref:Uncharacterized protein n=1 Tax=Flavipsychrobacter stenotrophus TaxID=2077091 RepID=A0A2S7T2K4_9BACT|nr:hypothetical protein [Flavipsychrobacter stenotrophus]PQJ13077.1 hypothetical protein CJD36_004860 [Flavipsychrobacter stenotrophus]
MLSSSINPSGIPTIIADNFCTQLLAFQNAIFARPAGDQIPTQQEINMQTKLLSNIIKIKKLNATDHVAKFMTTFCRFLGKEDKEQAQKIAGKFIQFMGLDSTDSDIATQETVIAETNPFEASPLQAEP